MSPPIPPSLVPVWQGAPHALVHVTHRPRLVALLDDTVGKHPVTLVVGGAGTGKTLSLADWATHGHPPAPVAWVTLHRGLRNPTRFWRAARGAICAALREDTPTNAGVPDLVDDGFVDAFGAALFDAPVCLVLDDVHVLDGSEVWAQLDLFVSLLPPGVHVVLVSRHDPPLAVQRLRVAGALGEVPARDLAFTDDEARLLLGEQGVRLAGPQLDRLLRTTEGWAAGLRLALLAIEAGQDPSAAAELFDGRNEFVYEYVMDEVLQGLDPADVELLRQTSVCGRVSGSLAERLLEDPAAGERLTEIAGRNAFVVELEFHGWYRYHPLMLDTLRRQLHEHDPALERELHRRAALWFEDHESWLDALSHAIASEDWDFVALVALRSAAVKVFSSERERLGALIELIPSGVCRDRADLLVIRAVAAFCRRDAPAEEALLADAETGLVALAEPVRSLTELTLWFLRAAEARRRGDAPAMVEASERAVAIHDRLDARSAPGWVSLSGVLPSLTAIGELWSGRPQRALGLMAKSMSHTRTDDADPFGAIYYQGHYAMCEQALGRLRSAHAVATQALQIARRSGSPVRLETRTAHLALAAVGVQRGDAVSTDAALDTGLAAAQEGMDPFVSAALHEVAVRRALLQGDLSSARRGIRSLRRVHGLAPHQDLARPAAVALEIEVELAAGDIDRAAAVLERHVGTDPRPIEHRPGEPDPLAIARARVLLARGAAADVRQVVAWQLGLEGPVGAEAWVVLALAERDLGHQVAAAETLAGASELAAPEGALLPFLRPRDDLDALLRRQLPMAGMHRAFVADVLRARGQREVPQMPVEALTDRELAVLAHVASLSSNEEIAESLRISVNTVKQHLKSINRKLGVSSRRDAYRVASLLGLLADAPRPTG